MEDRWLWTGKVFKEFVTFHGMAAQQDRCFGVMEYWSIGVLESWSTGVLGRSHFVKFKDKMPVNLL
jgi:hypothetical protein